ncbi:MAG: glycosyltransferase, exosortase A system-associated [Magnetococcales bacterium]|nr:glycosyltransferase, exosortase A system-associated [Magnetococcales bacterium]
MRILHVLDHSLPQHSGYAFRTLAILREQRKLAWETHHVTGIKHPWNECLEESVEGFSFLRTPPARGPLAQTPLLGQLNVITTLEKRLLEVAKKIKPDLLHAHSPALNGMAALRVGKRLGIPVVYEVRAFWEDAAVSHGTSHEWGPRYRLTRALESHVLKQADGVTVICEGLRREIIGRGIAKEKITVIPNAVDLERFQPQAPSNQPGLIQRLGLEGREIIGFAGSFYAYEGLSLFMEALPVILTKRPQVAVVLAGGGPEEKRLKKQAQQLGIHNRVLFPGRLPHAEMTAFYQGVDLLVYPRLSMRLTDLVTPLKPLEAMACGVVVAASDVGGHQELIKHGHNGFLFPAGDAQRLARELVTLLEDQTPWESIRQQAREYVTQTRNWPKSVHNYQQTYRNACS